MRRKRKHWLSAGSILEKTTKRLGMIKKMRQYELWHRWTKIAGPSLAFHAKPVRWIGSVLVVAVEHPSWMQELVYLKPDLLEKIRLAIPRIDIKDVRFEIGKIPPQEQTDESPMGNASSLNAEEREFIDQAANEIKDEDTKSALVSLMTKDFLRRKTKK